MIYDYQGLATLDNGCKYEGTFRNGLMHGVGTFTWADKVEYEGDWVLGTVSDIASYICIYV
jgi:hypothetical protein